MWSYFQLFLYIWLGSTTASNSEMMEIASKKITAAHPSLLKFVNDGDIKTCSKHELIIRPWLFLTLDEMQGIYSNFRVQLHFKNYEKWIHDIRIYVAMVLTVDSQNFQGSELKTFSPSLDHLEFCDDMYSKNLVVMKEHALNPLNLTLECTGSSGKGVLLYVPTINYVSFSLCEIIVYVEYYNDNLGKHEKDFYFHLQNTKQGAQTQWAMDHKIASNQCILGDTKHLIYHWMIHFGYDSRGAEISNDINNVLIYQTESPRLSFPEYKLDFVARASFGYWNWTLEDPTCFDFKDYDHVDLNVIQLYYPKSLKNCMGTTFIVSTKGPDFLKICEIEIFSFTHKQRALIEYESAHIFTPNALYNKKDLEHLHDGYILQDGLRPQLPAGCIFLQLLNKVTLFNIQMPDLPDNSVWEIFNVAIQTKKISNMVGDEITTSLQWGRGRLSKTNCKGNIITEPGQTIYNECPFSYAKLVTIAYDRKGPMSGGFGLCEVIISGENISFSLSIESEPYSLALNKHYVEENERLRLKCVVKNKNSNTSFGRSLYFHPALISYRWRIQQNGADIRVVNSTAVRRMNSRSPYLNMSSWKRGDGPNVSCFARTIFYPSVRILMLDTWTMVEVLYGPVIQVAPTYIARKGESITMNSTIEANPKSNIKVAWSMLGTLVEKFDHQQSLTIASAKDSDAGEYVITALRQRAINNSYLSWETVGIRTASTRLFVTDKIPSGGYTKFVKSEEGITMECPNLPYKFIGWYIGDTKWFYSNQPKLELPIMGKLSEFTFICSMETLENKKVQIPYNLISYDVAIENEFDLILQNKPITLNCEIIIKSYIKVETLKVTWYLNDERISQGTNFIHHIEALDCFKHVGVYKCDANFVLTIGQFSQIVSAQGLYRLPKEKCLTKSELSDAFNDDKLALLYARITFGVCLTLMLFSILHLLYAKSRQKLEVVPRHHFSLDIGAYSAYYENFDNVEFTKDAQGKKPLQFDYSPRDILPLR